MDMGGSDRMRRERHEVGHRVLAEHRTEGQARDELDGVDVVDPDKATRPRGHAMGLAAEVGFTAAAGHPPSVPRCRGPCLAPEHPGVIGQVVLTKAPAAPRRRDPTSPAPAQPPGAGGAGADGAPRDWVRGGRSTDTVHLRAPQSPPQKRLVDRALGVRSTQESSESTAILVDHPDAPGLCHPDMPSDLRFWSPGGRTKRRTMLTYGRPTALTTLGSVAPSVGAILAAV